MKKLLSLILLVSLIFCSFGTVSAKTPFVSPFEGFGHNVSGFSTEDVYGQVVTSSVLANADLTYMTYWAGWSNSSVNLLAQVNMLYQYYNNTSENDIQVIGVVCELGGFDANAARVFLEDNGYEFTNILADDVLASVFATSGYIPQTLIVDRNGIVRDHIIGGYESFTELKAYADRWLDLLSNHLGETCTVSYVNGHTGQTFHTAEVEYGTVLPSAPSAPSVPGYSFSGWSYDENILTSGLEQVVNIVMGDTVVTANYSENTYRVRFFDYNAVLLDTQYVQYGQSAQPPQGPSHSGYVFSGWDQDYSFITHDTDIYATYECPAIPNSGILGDINGDGTISVPDAIIIARMAMRILPQFNPEIADYNGNGKIDVSDAILVMRVSMGN